MEGTGVTSIRATPSRSRLGLRVAYRFADAAGAASRVLAGGSGRTLPGRVLMRLAPTALAELASGHRLAVVSGTNGKTTTTRMLVRALSDHGPVVTNADGANLVSGVVSALLAARHQRPSVASLEVDEVALVPLLRQCTPEILVLLNLSRDQLDRTSEVRSHVRQWGQALRDCPAARVVANADDPLVVAAVLAARPDGLGVTWVAAGKSYREDEALCPACGEPWDTSAGSWVCAGCGLSTPGATWSLVDGRICHDGSCSEPLSLALPGRVNDSNALMAVAAAHLMGVEVDRALELLRSLSDVAGRYRQVAVGGHRVRLLLAKNPAGWLESLAHIAGHAAPVLVSVNSQQADGLDPSWLWDVPFERLRVIALGDRRMDVSVRLLYADIDHDVAPDEKTALALLPPGECDLVANYTAFVRATAALGAQP